MNTEQPPITTPFPDQSRTHDIISGHAAPSGAPLHPYRSIFVAIAVILGIGILGWAVYFFFFKVPAAPSSPEQALADLHASSRPVTTTTTERLLEIKEITGANTVSKPLTPERQQAIMAELGAESQ